MQTGQHASSGDPSAPSNGASTLHDLFALTDEQILEIEPEGEVDVAPPLRAASSPASPSREVAPQRVIPSQPAQAGEARDRGNIVDPSSPQDLRHDSSSPESPRNDGVEESALTATEHGSRDTEHAPEPPAWLAAQMKDPWTGEEAKELWNGVQRAKKEAADYRAAFATPADARALKELYPGGVHEARAAAERARVMDDFDRAYFGAAGSSAEQTSASRAQLAARMLREDPAAFREMVFAGLRALEDAGKQPDATAVRATLASPGNNGVTAAGGGASPAPAALFVAGAQHAAPLQGDASANEAHVAAYAAFERAANEDLERAVGASIERTLEQALPVAQPLLAVHGQTHAQARVPALHERLGAAIRQDVEAALKGDRQLGEQVAQILSGRRLDDETRAEVVRLIGDRARQLVPSAAKRVLNDWTQTTLAAHRGKTERADAASARREVAPASPESRRAASVAVPARATSRDRIAESSPSANRTRAVDYRKLSDEQILEM